MEPNTIPDARPFFLSKYLGIRKTPGIRVQENPIPVKIASYNQIPNKFWLYHVICIIVRVVLIFQYLSTLMDNII